MPPGFFRRLALVLGLGMAGFVLWSSWGFWRARPTKPVTVANEPAETISVNPGYVGPQTCAECHQ